MGQNSKREQEPRISTVWMRLKKSRGRQQAKEEGVCVGCACLGMWGRKWEVVTEENDGRKKKPRRWNVWIEKEQWKHTSTHDCMAGDKGQVVAEGGLQRVCV